MDETTKTASAQQVRSLSAVYALESADQTLHARNMLEEWLRNEMPELGDMRSYEILLATNELLCNAFEHGDGGQCELELEYVDGALVVAVTNQTVDFLPSSTDEWKMPDATSRSGRGLAIVKNVADDVQVESRRSQVRIAARFDLDQKTPEELPSDATLAE